MKVSTTSRYTDVDGDYGFVEGICVECDRCGHQVECAGTGSGSYKRCAVLLSEECPQGEDNFYEVDE